MEIYKDNSQAEMQALLVRYATDPKLSFNWYDAAVLNEKFIELKREREKRLGLKLKIKDLSDRL